MNKALLSALKNFIVTGNELCIGQVTLSSLAQRYGTPLYVYSRNIIETKYRILRDALPQNLNIYYALKANPNVDIIHLMGRLYDGFDVSSAGEAERVIQSGFGTEEISFAGPGKTVSELKFAIEQDFGNISIESEKEFEHIKRICDQLGKTANVSVRVNPDFELSQAGMKMGGGPKQFGVDSERVPKLIKAINCEKGTHYNGIHIYAGSQNLDADQLLHTFEQILGYSVDLVGHTGSPIKRLNMGGGFGIPYFSHDVELDLAAVGVGLKRLIKQYSPQLGNPSFIVELGRFLVGESGVYISEVLYRKISKGQIFLITDGGMHHHLAASGNFGQSLVRRPMPITVANKQGTQTEKAHVTGPLCTPLDTFGFVELPIAQKDDLVCVLNSGAYGFSASPLHFLSHKTPNEIIV